MSRRNRVLEHAHLLTWEQDRRRKPCVPWADWQAPDKLRVWAGGGCGLFLQWWAWHMAAPPDLSNWYGWAVARA